MSITPHRVTPFTESLNPIKLWEYLAAGKPIVGILAAIWPFHTWSPVGHVAAPTAVSMLHAGVLKKFGLYGLIRVAVPLRRWLHLSKARRASACAGRRRRWRCWACWSP